MHSVYHRIFKLPLPSNFWCFVLEIRGDLCIGCGLCVPYCITGAISLKEGKAVVNGDKCVLCNSCVRAVPCPIEGAISASPPESLDESGSLATHLSDVITVQPRRFITNEFPQVLRNIKEVAFLIELGRPGQISTLNEMRKVIGALRKIDIELSYSSARWDTMLGRKIKNLLSEQRVAKKDEKLLNVKWICGPMLGFQVDQGDVPRVIEALEGVAKDLDTVMSVNVTQKFDTDGTISVMKTLEKIGIEYRPNGIVKMRPRSVGTARHKES